MAKKKSPKVKKIPQKPVLNFEVPFEPGKSQRIIIYSVLSVIAIFLSIYYIIYAAGINGIYGFPLDDPWIHLTFAKNLAEYQSFSYFQDQMATAGSTSPIYTFLLSAGFLITSDEMILSYVLGILFLVLAVIFFYKLSSYEFAKENYFAILCAGIFVVDKWMNLIAVSGMETTMYIFFLIVCFYFYKKRMAVPFAVFLGLILWARPDGVAFIGAIVVDYFLVRYFSKTGGDLKLFEKKDFLKIAYVFGGIVLAYFALNMILSGSLLPNTYNAKLTYYSPEFRSRGDFLEYEVWNYFTSGSYAILMAGFIFSVLKLIYDLSKKKYNGNFVYVLFILALVFIYWYKLPYAHRFGRYMMPVIPFFIIVASIGFRDLSRLIGENLKSRQIANGLLVITLAGTLFYSAVNYNENKIVYANECRYIQDRQVAAAMWIKNNTDENDVIATHDVGAIGYYSGRRIVDVAGLITPELINKLNDPDYNVYMTDYLKKEGVSYLVFLREWYRVANQNPLFSTVDSLPPEVMEIYRFNPDSTLILSAEVRSMIMYVQELLAQNAVQQAIELLNRAVALEPDASVNYFLLAYAYSMLGDIPNFESNLLKAVKLFPDYKEALVNLGNIYISKGDYKEAEKYLSRFLELSPGHPKGNELYLMIPDSVKTK